MFVKLPQCNILADNACITVDHVHASKSFEKQVETSGKMFMFCFTCVENKRLNLANHHSSADKQ